MIQKFDLHCHSIYSDGEATIPQVEEYCLRHNLGIALTDHNEIRGAVELIEKGRIPSLLGIEVGTKEGLEFLIYFKKVEEMELFYMKEIEPFRDKCFIVSLKNSLYQLLESANEIETFISISHPYAVLQHLIIRKLRKRMPELYEYILKSLDAIEIFNGNLSVKQNLRAKRLQECSLKKITVGSDSHELKYLGRTYISFEIADQSHESIFTAVQKNKYKNISYIEDKMRYLPISRILIGHITHSIQCKLKTII